MKRYIDFNTEKRRNAANSFEKDFLKLNQSQNSKKRKRFFKIHQQTNLYYP